MSWASKQFKRALAYKEALSRHHRKPRSLGGGNEDRNISLLPRVKHAAWHTLFQNWDAYRIAEEVNEMYLDPAYKMVVIPASMAIDPLIQIIAANTSTKKLTRIK